MDKRGTTIFGIEIPSWILALIILAILLTASFILSPAVRDGIAKSARDLFGNFGGLS